MEKELFDLIKQWHENDEHQKIVDAILTVNPDERNYDLIGRLAVAYNNLELYDKAIKELEALRENAQEDAKWHYRMAYAYYYKDMEQEALMYFLRAKELCEQDDKDDLMDDILEYIEECHKYIGQKQNATAPEMYSKEEMLAVEDHIEKYYGVINGVMHEIFSPDIHVDLICVPPTQERNYYMLFTMGMGAHRMNVSQELDDQGIDRAELMIALPPDWDINSSEEKDYWPLRWLKIMARLPLEQDTWLGWGHTVPNGEPFAENTELSGIILVMPDAEEEAFGCMLPDGRCINIYQMIPIYEEEMKYKLDNGAKALLSKFLEFNIRYVVDINRINTCKAKRTGSEKTFLKGAEEIKELLTDWDGSDGCIATDRITVDGCQVGYMYREEPQKDMPDSGWRFMAGDESDDYMDEPENSSIFKLNTICNYDSSILSFLKAPYGTAYFRDEDGVLQEEEFIPNE